MSLSIGVPLVRDNVSTVLQGQRFVSQPNVVFS
jgi:hypothetical protein